MTAPAPARSSREAYRDAVLELMRTDERLVCLDSDTGLFSGADFGSAVSRYVNVGIAEHTLMGTAAGLAKEGWIPLVNTMAAFAASRALEAVKVDIALNALPVRIVATHSGVSAGHLGPTHHALDDLAVMRALPGMTVVVPGDEHGTDALFRQALALPGPVYLRLGRNATPPLPAGPAVELGRAQVLRSGADVTIVACGPLPTLAALEAAVRLGRVGVGAGVLHVHTPAPLDAATITAESALTGLVVTVEEHWPSGGLGSAVAEVLAERCPVRVHRVAMAHEFVPVAGDQLYLLERGGVSAAAIVARVRHALVNRTEDLR